MKKRLSIVLAIASQALLTHAQVTPAAANYVRSGTQNRDYPEQWPYIFTHAVDQRYGTNDSILTNIINAVLGSEFDTFLLGEFGGNNINYQADTINVQTHSSIQIGGVRQTVVDHNGTDDLVAETTVMNATGNDRGDNEGLELHRDFYGFQNARFGGNAALIGADPYGHAKMRVSATSSYDLKVAASGRVLINISKRFFPPGNVTSVERYADPRFALVIMDSELTSAVRGAFGSSSVETKLVGGADIQKYDGKCPSTVVGSWGGADPYNADFAGNGSHTRSACLQLASTAGMRSGMLIGIWGAQANWEIEPVTTVVDATHVIVPLDHPHAPGELITAGAGLGWAISSPRNDYPARFLPGDASAQVMAQHVAYPVMEIKGNRVVLFTLSAGTQNQAELHLNLFQSNTPRSGLKFTPTVQGGVVKALNWTGGNAAGGDYATAKPWVPGVMTVLPPPSLAFGPNCSKNPVVSLKQTAAYQYQPQLVSGGSGCPSKLTITAQNFYPNPAIFYPATEIYRTEDPDHSCMTNDVKMPHCPTNGYLLTNALGPMWSSGDIVEQAPSWNQYIGSQEIVDASPDVMLSAQNGPEQVRKVAYPQSGQPIDVLVNTTPSSDYFGRASNHYQRTASLDSREAHDAQMTPPIGTEFNNTFSGVWLFDAPPMKGQGTSEGGFLTEVTCRLTAYSGRDQDLPCARGIRPDYDIFIHDMREVGGSVLRLTMSDASNCIKINGRCIATH